MKHRFGLSWVEITDVDFLRTEDQLRAGGRGEHSVHLKLLRPGEQDRIWPAVSEYKHYHGDGDHELDDGFNRSSDARGPQRTASLRFHRGTAPSVRSPAFFGSWHYIFGLWVILPLKWQNRLLPVSTPKRHLWMEMVLGQQC